MYGLLMDFIKQAFAILPPIIDSLNTDKKFSWAEKIEALSTRFYDPEFRLAVIGNFSCGKSTFLNALLKENLLTAAILPTTAIPTYIRWNKETLLNQTGRDKRRYYNPIITLTMTNGKIYSLTKSGKIAFERETGIHLPKEPGKIIDVLTTTNSLIGKVARTDLTFRERKGFENFCLIDTPGINPGDEESKEHILQTQKVLREDADAIILLYSAKDAMTYDTEKFMLENASHLMVGTIIILTKMDLVPKGQVEKIINNTAHLVKVRFNQAEPKIYSVSAQKAIDYFSGKTSSDEDLKWANDFNATVNEIVTQLSDRRSEIISQRISNLMRELIDSISTTISSELDELERERVNLEKASSEKLEEEFGELNRLYTNSLSEYRKNYQATFDDIERAHNKRVAEVEAQISRDKENIRRIEKLRKLSAES